MNLNFFKKKSYFDLSLIIFLFLYFLIGIYLSLNTGISHDEFHEQKNWEFNMLLIDSLWKNQEIEITYIDKFYGIGFQYISQPFQYFFSEIVSNYFGFDAYGSKLITKHSIVFIFFFISSLFFFKILLKITNNNQYSILGLILYLTYPYLLGHSFFNSKDIPFLSLWLVCTFLSCHIFELLKKENILKFSNLLILSFLTAYLFSIRITGILILIQYFVTFVIFLNTENYSIKKFINNFFLKIIIFVLLLFVFVVFLYPIFWINPLNAIEAIKFMGNFYHDVCTLTLGKCIKAQDIDSIYIFIWLFFKIPLVILIGIFLIPFTEKKIFKNSINNIYFGTILLSPIIILTILILNKVPLYDEIRQVMFLVPLIFLLGLISFFFFSKKISKNIILIFIFFFIYENFNMYPYQYTWFNMSARTLDLSKNFELEYQGISGKELSKKIQNINIPGKKHCIIGASGFIKPYLNQKIYNCYYPFSALETNIKRPFWVIQHVRNLKKSIPFKCKILAQEKISLTFYKRDLVAGNLLECY